MTRWAFVALTLSTLAFATTAAARDWADCIQQINPDLSINVCSEIIDSGRASEADLPYAHISRALAYEKTGDLDRAIKDWDRILELKPYNPAYLINRGLVYLRKGDRIRSVTDLRAAARLIPATDPLHERLLARAAEIESGTAPTVAANQGVLDFSDRGIPLSGGWADCAQLANPELGIRACSEIIELGKETAANLAIARLNRGAAYASRGDNDSAIEDFGQALQLKPDLPEAYVDRGEVYRREGETDRALAEFNKAIQLRPHLIEVYFGLPSLPPGFQLTSLPSGPVALATLHPTSPYDQFGQPPTIPTDFGLRVALVIGNGEYTSVARLRNPRNDAEAVAEALRQVGFASVDVVLDASREEIVRALQSFQERTADADWAVIYFAGHGIEMDGINYLVPVDARLAVDTNIQDEAIALPRMVSAAGARKLNVVIVDACRDNPFVPRMRRMVASRSIGRGLAPVETEGSTLIAFAAKAGEIAEDGDGANSPFAAALVKRLREPSVEITKMFRLVTDDVLAETDGHQRPFTYASLPGSEDFFFVAQHP